jgi:hypothetical protein
MAKRIFIVKPGQHDDRDFGRGAKHFLESIEAAAVREREVEQDEINASGGNTVESVGKAADRFDEETSPIGMGKDIAHHPDHFRLVFDQHDSDHLVHRHSARTALAPNRIAVALAVLTLRRTAGRQSIQPGRIAIGRFVGGHEGSIWRLRAPSRPPILGPCGPNRSGR